MVVNRFDVYLIELDPAIGGEIKKTRPCVIVSPNEMRSLSFWLVEVLMILLLNSVFIFDLAMLKSPKV
jgi:mRNA-degrading endonuclease toxin of MazEF toxin-antitoxin module